MLIIGAVKYLRQLKDDTNSRRRALLYVNVLKSPLVRARDEAAGDFVDSPAETRADETGPNDRESGRPTAKRRRDFNALPGRSKLPNVIPVDRSERTG